MGTSSANMPMRTHFGAMSFSVRSMAAPSCAASVDATNAPLSDWMIEERMENSVWQGPTSIVPTAMGRTMLYQTVKEMTSQEDPATPNRRGRSGSKKSSSGMMTHQAMMPPEPLIAARRGPMM